jgi:nicotinamidase/pyrazinamidase
MKALVLIDIQNDFLPGGALAVNDGNHIIPIANRLLTKFNLIIATQDWHPADHASFAANHPGKRIGQLVELDGLPQVLWPVHCVQNTPGAELSPHLDQSRITRIFHKGTDPRIDSYSGFFDNGHRKSTGLTDYLRARNIDQIYVMGLATDYCVKFTALDAIAEGFTVFLIQDACRGVNLNPGDVEKALAEMKQAGVLFISSDAITSSSQTLH